MRRTVLICLLITCNFLLFSQQKDSINVVTKYWENGNIKSQTTNFQYEPKQKIKFWAKNGQLILSASMTRDRQWLLDSSCTIYNEDGSIYQTYDHDNAIITSFENDKVNHIYKGLNYSSGNYRNTNFVEEIYYDNGNIKTLNQYKYRGNKLFATIHFPYTLNAKISGKTSGRPKKKIEFYPNGDTLMIFTPAKDLRTSAKFFNKSGKIDTTAEGNCSCLINYYPNGQLQIENCFKNKKKGGYYKTWTSNGKLIGEIGYANYDADFMYISWLNPSAQAVTPQSQYGNCSEDATLYDSKGKVSLHYDHKKNVAKLYENGSLVSSAKYNFNDSTITRKSYYKNGKLKHELTEWSICKANWYRIPSSSSNSIFWEYNDNLRVLEGERNRVKSERTFYPSGKIMMQMKKEYRRATPAYTFYNDKGEMQEGYSTDPETKSGCFIEFYANGQKKSELNFKNGILDGSARRWYENGQLSEDSFFADGKTNGLVTAFFTNGQLKLKAEYKKGRGIGTKLQFHENGQMKHYSCTSDKSLHLTYQNDTSGNLTSLTLRTRYGFPMYIFKKDTIENNSSVKEIDGTQINGIPSGPWKGYYANGQCAFSINYSDSLLNGPAILYDSSGMKLVETFYKNGLCEGNYNHYYVDGTLCESGAFKNNKRNGIWHSYFENGNKRDELLYDSSGHTILKRYYESGDLKFEAVSDSINNKTYWIDYYENGSKKQQKVKSMDENQHLFTIDFFDNDSIRSIIKPDLKQEGRKDLLSFHSNGELYEKRIEQDRKQIGSTLRFHKNGELAELRSFRDGNRDGTWRYFSLSGALDSCKQFENGLEISNEENSSCPCEASLLPLSSKYKFYNRAEDYISLEQLNTDLDRFEINSLTHTFRDGNLRNTFNLINLFSQKAEVKGSNLQMVFNPCRKGENTSTYEFNISTEDPLRRRTGVTKDEYNYSDSSIFSAMATAFEVGNDFSFLFLAANSLYDNPHVVLNFLKYHYKINTTIADIKLHNAFQATIIESVNPYQNYKYRKVVSDVFKHLIEPLIKDTNRDELYAHFFEFRPEYTEEKPRYKNGKIISYNFSRVNYSITYKEFKQMLNPHWFVEMRLKNLAINFPTDIIRKANYLNDKTAETVQLRTPVNWVKFYKNHFEVLEYESRGAACLPEFEIGKTGIYIQHKDAKLIVNPQEISAQISSYPNLAHAEITYQSERWGKMEHPINEAFIGMYIEDFEYRISIDNKMQTLNGQHLIADGNYLYATFTIPESSSAIKPEAIIMDLKSNGFQMLTAYDYSNKQERQSIKVKYAPSRR